MNTEPTCPHCKVKMKRRKGKHGDFFGCSNFPVCKFTSKTRMIGYQHPREFRDNTIQQGDFNTRKG